MNNNPKVTVIIPTYNRAHLIQRSIKSVLDQTYKNIELIIVDDSTDDTEAKVKEIKDDRIIYIKNKERKGVSRARNMAIEIAKGELIAFQDSDDEWVKDKLEKQVNALMNAPEKTGAVYCRMIFKDSKTGKTRYEKYDVVKNKDTYAKGPRIMTPSTQTVVIKKSVLDDVGYFDERIKFGEDTELAIRVTKKYDYTFVDEPLIIVTRNHEQLTLDSKAHILGRELIYEKHKNYLSSGILYTMCRTIATYYFITKDIKKAKKYLREAVKYKRDIKTFTLFGGTYLTPFLVEYFYDRKYKGKVPIYNNGDRGFN